MKILNKIKSTNCVVSKNVKGMPDDKKGILYSLITVLPYSIIPLIFLVQYSHLGGDGISADMAKGAVNVVAKDILSGLLFMIMVLTRNFAKGQRTIIKTFRTREGFYSGISGIFGGPIGYMLFNTAYYLAGASFSHMFSSVEPIIVVMFAVLVWKRKFKWQIWLGVILAVIGVSGSIVGSSLGGTPWKAVVGSVLAIAGAGAWSVESILMDRAFTHSNGRTSTLDLMNVKAIVAICFNLIVMFPLMGMWHSNASNTYLAFGELFTNIDFFWRFITAGLLLMLGRLWFFSAVKYDGATVANVIYELTAIITPLVALTVWAISGNYPGADAATANEHLTATWQIEFWITSAFIIAGAILVTIYSPKLNREKEKKLIKDSQAK